MRTKKVEPQKSHLCHLILTQAYRHPKFSQCLIPSPTNCPNCGGEYVMRIGDGALGERRFSCQYCATIFFERKLAA